MQTYYVTPALRHMCHMLMRQTLPAADSTSMSSTAEHHYKNWSHFHLHHLSWSQWWGEDVQSSFLPHTAKESKTFLCVLFFFSLNKEKQAQIQISNTVPVISLPHIYWIKPIREVTEFCLIPMRNVIRQSFNRLWGSGMSQWSRLCISQVIVSPIKIHRHLTGNV